ncbi:MAG: hypothetical protein A3C43_09285 [Candidatus Schekmanbacteria bacterium RIFCSPHIGHO2_02_FULL_38_11]|uniref:Metallopeptidase family protein n=1 Tax=Candidatus Schekmanbacteria bacterium RIFCSPLOWO2_12_FULL_38_15 TaxID=1817883 RepID=A0A1F7SFW4_9BACT|nr:MAG: hypothetical protein A2043_00775 [Candidatus Schekmanbacteria bacterium GWA2_38_9]OGL49082.1 MAG: hypothetical protein A3H37_03870 [Candidatus Schekmanbacteria bacterium RIFCSPLOWO2_02_FULL_38_14]OGL49207.1 MAG: hypothetical protein A3C43_09285 [Candidatus Schekmanbacteria bacterium RIFCSPHIGHO2_02_FULL_38_11]OGL52057.1 MAG: hypothetical protein A3G31_06455 [Candidatus Schekmanbacteria bacterium RIFCSPLOWO2_12_FULL_38_15]
MTTEEFERIVEETILNLPKRFKKRIENLAVVIEDEPSYEILSHLNLKSKKSLLGLYQGIPITKRDSNYCNVLPDKITIFKKPIEALNQEKEKLKDIISKVVIHEIGHYFGMSENDLEQI